jgi:hypothetical protein
VRLNCIDCGSQCTENNHLAFDLNHCDELTKLVIETAEGTSRIDPPRLCKIKDAILMEYFETDSVEAAIRLELDKCDLLCNCSFPLLQTLGTVPGAQTICTTVNPYRL